MERTLLDFEREIAEVKSEQSAQREQIRTAFSRLDHQDKVLDAVQELAFAVRDLGNQQAATNEKVEDLRDDVETIKSKPAKRWEMIIDKIIGFVLGGLVAYILMKLGLA